MATGFMAGSVISIDLMDLCGFGYKWIILGLATDVSTFWSLSNFRSYFSIKFLYSKSFKVPNHLL
jgi:hypothetical protein